MHLSTSIYLTLQPAGSMKYRPIEDLKSSGPIPK